MNIYLSHEIDVDAPAEAVWSIVADYSLDPRWRTGVVQMVPTPLGTVRAGTRTSEDLRLAGKSWHNDGEVVEVDPGRSFTWRTTSGADARGGRTVEPLDGGRCRLRLDLVVRPNGVERLMAPVLRRMIDRNQRTDLQRLRELAEGRVADQAGPTPATAS
jgi:uncharacterized protein YndB with AHSA1/START domain